MSEVGWIPGVEIVGQIGPSQGHVSVHVGFTQSDR